METSVNTDTTAYLVNYLTTFIYKYIYIPIGYKSFGLIYEK